MRFKKREKIGRLNRRIVIQEASVTRDDYGGESLSWSTLATVWASVEYTGSGSSEDIEADRITALRVTIFTIRYRGDLTEKMRISYNSDIYEVKNILPDESEKQYMVLECEKVEP